MKINVGTTNAVKIAAVNDAVSLYPQLFKDSEIGSVEVKVDLYGHPKNIKETIEGAIKRAKQAFVNCDYSFGLEGGLIEVPHSKSGYLEVGACAVYDGKEFYIGLSPAFEWPEQVTKMILQGEADASQALKQLGLTQHEKLGSMPGGAVGFLTDGRLKREDFTKYSIIMALVRLEKAAIYL